MAKITYPIEPLYITQKFGENPKNYARFGLDGHNGWDFRTKFVDSPDGKRSILSPWDAEFFRKGSDPAGYGTFYETLVQLTSLYKLTFAHCDHVKQFTKATEGQETGVSDNTGNSTGSHLHLTVKRVARTPKGLIILNNTNGYQGAIDPQEFFDELQIYKNRKTGETPSASTGGNMDERTQKLLKKYGKGSIDDFEQFLKEHLGENGQGGYLKETRDTVTRMRYNLCTLLNIPQTENETTIYDALKRLVDAPNQPNVDVSNQLKEVLDGLSLTITLNK